MADLTGREAVSDAPAVAAGRRAPWWLFLVTGFLWIMIAWWVLRFDVRTVATVATLAGVVVLIAAAAEAVHVFTAPGWKWLHGLLAVLFAITGIVILFRPGASFVWLAAFVGWYLLIKGFFDIVMGFATKRENDAWWLLVLVGIVEVLLGFWAAGEFVRSAYLLVILVGALALAHGIGDIVMAFRLRGHQHAQVASEATTPADLGDRSTYRAPTAGTTTGGPTPGAPAPAAG
jgi:uncharacterized membrane protein HdeD (DUF308 family)